MINTCKLLGLLLLPLMIISCTKESDLQPASTITIEDALSRKVTVSEKVDYVICSGAGCLRLLTYLNAQDKIVAVDDMETKEWSYDARPYALANPRFREYPVFGQFRGFDNPELIVSMDTAPQVIFKTYSNMGFDPDELQDITGIPVVVLNYGGLTSDREDFYASLRLMASIVGKQERAGEVIDFIENTIADLKRRTGNINTEGKKRCYVGGISYMGPLGLQSTEPLYPPFYFTNALNVAFHPEGDNLYHLDVSKEILIEWDPDIIFIDLGTFQSDPQANALYELLHDPAFAGLTAVTTGEVYGLLPYNWYGQNFGSTLANAYYVGKVLYPGPFSDIDPAEKADEIYSFLVGAPAFESINEDFSGLAYQKIPLK
jgi:iron complex transport system substrate-binding protein